MYIRRQSRTSILFAHFIVYFFIMPFLTIMSCSLELLPALSTSAHTISFKRSNDYPTSYPAGSSISPSAIDISIGSSSSWQDLASKTPQFSDGRQVGGRQTCACREILDSGKLAIPVGRNSSTRVGRQVVDTVRPVVYSVRRTYSKNALGRRGRRW